MPPIEDDVPTRITRAIQAIDEVDQQRLEPPAGLYADIAREVGTAPHRPRRWIPVVAAAAVVLIVALGAVAVFGGEDSPDVTAQAELAPLTGSGTASARVVANDSERLLELDVRGLPETDGFYEIWLLDEAVTQLVSLGPLRTDGTYVVPRGVDLDILRIVDISTEPLDGDPTHSGSSVLRGQLDGT